MSPASSAAEDDGQVNNKASLLVGKQIATGPQLLAAVCGCAAGMQEMHGLRNTFSVYGCNGISCRPPRADLTERCRH